MPTRLFIEPEWVDAAGRRVRLPRDRARYLRTVLRLGTGAPLTLFDGSGREYRAVLREAGRREATAEIVEVAGPAPAAGAPAAAAAAADPTGAPRAAQAAAAGAGRVAVPRIRLVLAQGLVKGDKLDLVVQKSTELGASAVHPVLTRRAVPRPADGAARLARWRRIAVEAAEQCGRLDVPAVHPVEPLEAFLARPFPGALRLCFHEGAARGLPGVERLRDVLASHAALLRVPRGSAGGAEPEPPAGGCAPAPMPLGAAPCDGPGGEAGRPAPPDLCAAGRAECSPADVPAAGDAAAAGDAPAGPPWSGVGGPAAGTVVVLIGPEGGLDPEEADAARAAGFRWVGLGPRILRAETAALAALAVLAYELES